MSFKSTLFSDLQLRLKSWLQIDDESSFITSTSLDLLNRAQNWLIMYKPWSKLLKRSALTLADKNASVPSDFAYELKLYSKPSGATGAPDIYYTRENKYERGYEINDGFTKAAGHAEVISFYQVPSWPVYLEYIRTLDDFTGEGVEYSFFPGELILAVAKVIHAEEMGGLTTGEVAQLRDSRQLLLDAYVSSSQYNNGDLSMHVNDAIGNPIEIDDYTMMGSELSNTNACNRYDRDYDCG